MPRAILPSLFEDNLFHSPNADAQPIKATPAKPQKVDSPPVLPLPVIEKVNEIMDSCTFHVGKFTFCQEDNAVIVHNNAGEMPVFIRMNTYPDADAAYTAARKQAYFQARA